LSKNKPIELWC